MEHPQQLIPPHGDYRSLKSFQLARLVYDLTVRFCNRYISRSSRTRDQMIQAARSGVQNIAEGSLTSATSKKMELKLTNVARASLEELLLDYEDFLRQNGFSLWDAGDLDRQKAIALKVETADEVVKWIHQIHRQRNCPLEEAASNTIHTIIEACQALLLGQLQSQASKFLEEGGFTERLYNLRKAAKGSGP